MANEEENKNNPIIQKGKKQGKKIKRRAIRIGLPILIPIIIFAIIASGVFSIFSNIVDLARGFLTDTFTATANGFEITDERLDEIIAAIEGSGTKLEDLGIMR